MKRNTVIKSLQLAGFLLTSIYACASYADWSQKHPYGGYNNGYGDFPPIDIDEQLSGNSNKTDTALSPTPAVESMETKTVTQQPATANSTTQTATTQVPQQAVQQPVYGGYYQNAQAPYAYGYPAQPYNRNRGYSGPWNNSRSGFSGPWNNNRYGYYGPWNNRGTNFSMPWGNNRSGFTPWGNGGSWSW